MPPPRLLLCRHCKVWYAIKHLNVPVICPNCEKAAHWTTAENMERKPFRLSKTDIEFLLCNKIRPWREDDDDGA